MFAAAIFFRLRTFDGRTASETALGGGTTTEDAQGNSLSIRDQEPPETGTMVIVENATSAATRTSGASARDQRYHELLRTAPPTGVQIPGPPQPVAKKTLLQRMASAIGLGQEKKASAAPPPSAPRPPRGSAHQQQSQQASSNQNQQTGNETKTPAAAEETDAESDTRPPQLVGLEFMPNQVQDGETTILAITAQDDRSGIRTISGVIANPAGATVTGFAAQREADTNRYTAKILVPKDAAEGDWHIKYLTMADNASNSVNLAYGQALAPALARFRVTSSRSDAKGPELKSLWIDKRDMAAGEKNTIFVQAEDDKSGLKIVSGVFVSPNKVARLGFGCKVSGTGAWECSLNVPACVDCGVWQLEQLQMQDNANNTTTVRLDNQMVSAIQVAISGDRCDGAPPVLTALSLSPLSVANGQPAVINVAATIEDDNCGGATLSGLVTGPQGQRLNIHFDQSKDGQNFTGKINLDATQARGKYVVSWIQALDKGQNLKAYSLNDPTVGRVTFTIE